MKRYNLTMYIWMIILILGLGYMFFYKFPSKEKQITKVVINDKNVEVELADTTAKITKGLMFRDSLKENSGMLFIMPNIGIHSFWMANTYIPLDMIWIDENKNIVHIEKEVPPCTKTGKLQSLCKTYKPSAKAKYVLEVNAGYATENNVLVGNKVEFK